MTSFSKPPMRDGVSPSTVHLPFNHSPRTGLPWSTIFEFLVEHFDQISSDIWQQRMIEHKVLDRSGQPVHQHTPYQPHTKIYYYRELPQEAIVPFQEKILFQNEHLLVVDKPHFLTVSPTGRYVKQTLLVRLKQQLGNEDISPIHRLDRETAGVMLFSLQAETRSLYQNLFQQRQVDKVYEAIAPYRPDLMLPLCYESRLIKGEPFFTMQESHGEPNSFTRIELLQIKNKLARYQLTPITGKQHQLRVHMAALGIPILNDSFYPMVQSRYDDFSRPLQLLAKSIAFIDPVTQYSVCYTSEQHLSF
ncbi:pseudouridine synthase [Alkanindiges sp. WGS2144]|uniref:pseudouridine synthase n=1 Tax=Alkanindiges sp. WGS2144 TaxID=3366808 RepID=UPI0037502704